MLRPGALGPAPSALTVDSAVATHLSTFGTATAISAQVSRAAILASTSVSGSALFTNALITMSQTKLTLATAAAIVLLAAIPIAGEISKRSKLQARHSARVDVSAPSSSAAGGGTSDDGRASDDPTPPAPPLVPGASDSSSAAARQPAALADGRDLAIQYGRRMGEIKRKEYEFRQF
ncbi:MAG: hypothetical protein ACKV19_07355 [Verrucomicrobiales bacterium]